MKRVYPPENRNDIQQIVHALMDHPDVKQLSMANTFEMTRWTVNPGHEFSVCSNSGTEVRCTSIVVHDCGQLVLTSKHHNRIYMMPVKTMATINIIFIGE